jgi:phage tail sheath protein FI
MPGIVIETAVRTGPSTATVRASSQFFVVGLAERGTTTAPVKVESLEQFETYFGGYQSYSYLHPTVQTFFEEGGTRAYVARVVGSAADSGSLTLDDGDDDNTITITAVGEGNWSTRIKVQVVDASGDRNVKILLDDVEIFATGAQSTVTGIINAINTSVEASPYVVASNDNSTNNNPLPAVLAATALSAGDDDRAAVVAADYVNALELFNDSYGDGAVAVVENTSDTVKEGLVEHANTHSRIALLHSASGTSVSTVIADAEEITDLEHAEHAAYYFPWVYVPTSVNGVNRLIPPTGYVAAKRAQAHNQTGPHAPAAGLMSRSRFVNGVETDIDRTNGDLLDNGKVNAIRVLSNTIRIYGARSCSSDVANFRFYTAQDVLNSVVTQAFTSLEDLVFSVIDGRNIVLASVESRLVSLLEGLKNLGALYPSFDAFGVQVDPGYTVKCNPSINPLTQLADGTIKAEVGIRVSSIGDKINVTIVKSNLTTSIV